MSNKETGGPAFPFNKRPEQAFPSTFKSLDGKEQIHAWGMTLRDYFAAKAMQGLITSPRGTPDGSGATDVYYAKCAYLVADAMLKARET
jgi:hypothetical protein